MSVSKIRRPLSHDAFQNAKNLIPGGVNSPARAFGGVGGEPLFIANAKGPWLFDLDGNRYLDFIGSWGPMILGHQHPKVMDAVRQALDRGFSYGAPSEAESELASLVIEAVPTVEMVRFVNSGTEASMSAIRLARGHTGRDKIIKFSGCYHGHVDSLLVAAGSAATTLGVPSSPGIPAGTTKDTIVLNYNDCQALREAFRTHGDSLAGVILEPVAGNMGLVLPTEEFRKALRELTRNHGSLLIYDEVMTGFRLAFGGVQELFGDEPDLTVLGKIIGGGMPVGAYGGRREIMNRVMPAGPVFQAGTLSGNPVAMAAGIATLKELKKTNPYPMLDQLAKRLVDGLHKAATRVNLPHKLNRIGSMWTLFFTDSEVTDYASAKTCDTARFGRFFWGMMDRGYYLPCSQFEAAFTSILHDEALIDATVAAAEDCLAEIAKESV
ncbi:MAG: glutamate-1-semialdehyde-2,1-aminomutase [Gemmataceae bacterium]|nr:glutamate-1-semialdehyde-2,1-aminomutase [Gemmataceae bacterium]